MKKLEIKILAETTILVAMAIVVDLVMKAVPILLMPNGGHITLAGLILVIMACRNGLFYGFCGCFIYATINFLMDGYTTHIVSILLDYYVAFGVFALGGLYNVFKESNKKNMAIFIIILLFTHFIRFVSSTISGVIVWDTPWIGSIAYNGPYVLASCVVSILVGVAMFKSIVNIKK